MAEIKRMNLQPIDNGQTSKKSSKTTKQIAPSFRFEINLIDSNDEKYTEVNYAQLLKSAEKKRRKEKKTRDNPTNGFTPFGDDDDDKILDVARYYEEKYGNRKKSDYVDLGAGYDENDSFIDNTDAYDEVVPEEVTTVHGGFYVNSGPLEFKDSDKVSSKINVNSNNEEGENDENEEEDDSDDDDDSSSEEDTDDQISNKKINKRALSSSENEEAEKIQHPPKSKVCTGGIIENIGIVTTGGIEQLRQQQQQQQHQQQQQQPPKIMIRTDLTGYPQSPKSKVTKDDAECVIID